MKTASGSSPVFLPFDASFLAEVPVWGMECRVVVEQELQLGAFPGPSLRGALGRRLHQRWCLAAKECSGACEHVEACGYSALFGAGGGEDGRRSLVLAPPIPMELEQIARGGAVDPPYQVSAGRSRGMENVLTEAKLSIPVGATVRFGLTLLGQAVALGDDLQRQLAGMTLAWSGGQVRVAAIQDAWRSEEKPRVRKLSEAFARPARPSREVWITAITPVAIKTEPGVDPRGTQFVEKLLERCLVRAREALDDGRNAGMRSPRMALPRAEWAVTAALVREMTVNRYSVAQDQRMPLWGYVGTWRVAGEIGAILPLLGAGEVLGVGQHTTMGFGRIRIFEGE